MIANQNYNIAIADDHKLILAGIRNIVLDNQLGTVVGDASNGFQLLQLLQHKKVHLAIIDVNMPEMNGVQTAKKIVELYPDVAILILSQYENIELIKELKIIGVKGYLSKSFESDQLIEGIKTIKENCNYFPLLDREHITFKKDKTQLTTRELEILSLIAKGKTSKEISCQLFLSQYTVETHRKNCMRKLEVNSTIQLINVAKDKGYILYE
ncbi:response regulator transcription factor [Flavobacterium franklandianum]|uniref:Response regulator transcription factor n=1 Tax=Flavobacterium franklandianum TaxID=2594430 RepID=A0A553CQX0_9FLAO|nr:response regulator transcription factor [Flavobacterium franklandianum]TRX22877.1 response regulator transcription factor [Flavobacterium franklandianum]TRX24976.1 response regulator transcription factor [Flavobacterium franklandianum]